MRRSLGAAVLILSLAVVAAAAAERPVPFRTIDQGSQGMAVGARPARVIVRDGISWNRLWRQLHAGETPRPAVPRIDFARHMLVAVRRGFAGSGGHGIRITRIVDDGRRLLVTLDLTEPGPDCVTPAVVTAPYHVVRVRRSAKPVSFRAHRSVYHCG